MTYKFSLHPVPSVIMLLISLQTSSSAFGALSTHSAPVTASAQITCESALQIEAQNRAQELLEDIISNVKDSAQDENPVAHMTQVSTLLAKEFAAASDEISHSLSGRNEVTEIILSFSAHHDLSASQDRIIKNLNDLLEITRKKESTLQALFRKIFGNKDNQKLAVVLKQIGTESQESRILLQKIRDAIPAYNDAYNELKRQRQELEKSYAVAIELRAQLGVVTSDLAPHEVSSKSLTHAVHTIQTAIESITLLRTFADEQIKRCEQQTEELLRLQDSTPQQMNIVSSSLMAVQHLKIPDSLKADATKSLKQIKGEGPDNSLGPQLDTHLPKRTFSDLLRMSSLEQQRYQARLRQLGELTGYFTKNQDKLTMSVDRFLRQQIGSKETVLKYLEENGAYISYQDLQNILRTYHEFSGKPNDSAEPEILAVFARARAKGTGFFLAEWVNVSDSHFYQRFSGADLTLDRTRPVLLYSEDLLDICLTPGIEKQLGWLDVDIMIKSKYTDLGHEHERIVGLIGKLHANGNLTREEALGFKNQLLSRELQDKLEKVINEQAP